MKRKSHPRGRRKEPSENADGSQIDLSDSFRLWWKAQGLVLGRFWAKTVLHLRWILLLLSHVSHVRLCATPQTAAHRAPIPGILQVRTLEWVTISFSSAWKWKVKVKSLSHPTLHDPMDCHLLGSSIHGIFQARVLEWGAIPYSGLCV